MNGYVAGGYAAAIFMMAVYAARVLWRTRRLRNSLPPEDRS